MREKLLMVAGAVFLGLIALGAAAVPQGSHPPGGPEHQGGMMKMMMHDAMPAEDVAKLTDEMNKATGDAKIEAMARLLTVLAGQHTMMMEHMKTMHAGATGHAAVPGETPHAAH